MPLSDAQIKQRIKQAFLPLICTTTLTDAGTRLDFAILNADGTTLTSMDGVIFDHVREEAALDIVISYMRDKVEEARQGQTRAE